MRFSCISTQNTTRRTEEKENKAYKKTRENTLEKIGDDLKTVGIRKEVKTTNTEVHNTKETLN